MILKTIKLNNKIRIIFGVFIGFYCFSFIQTSFAQTYNKSQVENIPKYILRKIKRDAARLALRYETLKGVNKPYISSQIIDEIYKGLIFIYKDNQGNSLENNNIHTFPNPIIDQLKIVYFNTANWVNESNTSDIKILHPDLKNLIDKYDLVIQNHTKWTNKENIIILRSKIPMNINFLKKEIESISGFSEIDNSIPLLQGNDITVKKIKGGWEFEFIFQYNHLNDGLQKHVWLFQYIKNKPIVFLYESGDQLPQWLNK